MLLFFAGGGLGKKVMRCQSLTNPMGTNTMHVHRMEHAASTYTQKPWQTLYLSKDGAHTYKLMYIPCKV